MIELNDPYWKRLTARVVVVALVLGGVAFAALPTSEESHRAGSSSVAGSGLTVSELMWSPAFDDQHLRVWVNVTNSGTAAAENLTGQLRGVAPTVNLGGETDTRNGNLARGASGTQTFSVVAGTSATVSAQITSRAPLASLSLEVKSPNGESFSGQASGSGSFVALSTNDVEAGLFGDWTATVTESGGFRGVAYQLTIDSQYVSASPNETLDALPPGEGFSFLWFVDSADPAPTLPPGASIAVTGTVFDTGGRGEMVSYESAEGAAPVERPVSGGAGGEAFLTSGEFLGFTAIGIIGVSVATGALRTRGGRSRSQERARPEVSWHRFAWLAVLLVLLGHGLAQLIGGHLYLQAALLGTAATALIAATIWLNAYQRPRVLAMEWPKWLRVKLLLVAGILLFIALHLALYGRHFAG